MSVLSGVLAMSDASVTLCGRCSVSDARATPFGGSEEGDGRVTLPGKMTRSQPCDAHCCASYAALYIDDYNARAVLWIV